MKYSAAILLILAGVAYAAPATQKTEDYSASLERLRGTAPGMVAAVIRANDIVILGAAGTRRRDKPEKVTLDDKFHLGSCTKAMTATLCATLVEEGKLKWDSTLADIFPEEAPKMRPAYRAVTLTQLLTHHAGVPAAVDVGNWYTRCAAPGLSMIDARELILDAIVTHKPQAAPGTKFIYANAGFVIAGHMAEKVTGKPWEQLMQERIFGPLHMTSAGFGPPGTPKQLDQPRGHGIVGLAAEPVAASDNPPAMGPAGTVHCTISDWAKFIALHLSAARGEAHLLKLDTFKKLHTPVPAHGEGELDYAMGWCCADRPWGGGAVLNHGGTNSFWYCETWIAPKKNFAVLVMCNQGGPLGQKPVQTVIEDLIMRAMAR